MGRACSTHGVKRNTYRVFVRKAEGKRSLERLGRRCEDNIKMDLKDIGWGGMDWINLAQHREQWRDQFKTATNLRVT
jgi:hypothetical protein